MSEHQDPHIPFTELLQRLEHPSPQFSKPEVRRLAPYLHYLYQSKNEPTLRLPAQAPEGKQGSFWQELLLGTPEPQRAEILGKALKSAIEHRFVRSAQELVQAAGKPHLFPGGAKPALENALKATGHEMLHKAVISGDSTLAKIAIDAAEKAESMGPLCQWNQCLLTLVEKNNQEILDYALAAGLRTKAIPYMLYASSGLPSSNHCFHHACEEGNISAVRKLLETARQAGCLQPLLATYAHGALTSACNWPHKTPPALVNLLIEAAKETDCLRPSLANYLGGRLRARDLNDYPEISHILFTAARDALSLDKDEDLAALLSWAIAARNTAVVRQCFAEFPERMGTVLTQSNEDDEHYEFFWALCQLQDHDFFPEALAALRTANLASGPKFNKSLTIILGWDNPVHWLTLTHEEQEAFIQSSPDHARQAEKLRTLPDPRATGPQEFMTIPGIRDSVRSYGFTPELYHRLLPTLQLACRLENNELEAPKFAYKLAVLFDDKEQATGYLNAFARRWSGPEDRHQLVHNAMLFDLPQQDGWDIARWRELVLQFGPEATQFLGLAPKIEQYCAAHGLPFPDSPAALYHVGGCLSYARGSEHPAFATLARRVHLSEQLFNQCLDIAKAHPKTHDLLPDIAIDGKDIGCKDFYFEKLAPSDPAGLILGKLTNCCQYVGDQGESCAIYGATRPNSGFYVWRRKTGDERRPTDPIVAQSWAWLSDDRNTLVLDSFEGAKSADNHFSMDTLLSPFLEHFTHLASEASPGLAVHIGLGGQTPEKLGYDDVPRCPLPADYKGHSDAGKQKRIPPVNRAGFVARSARPDTPPLAVG